MAIRIGKSRWCITVAALSFATLAIKDASSAGVIYTYDLSGRVTTALYDNGTCISYSYDANGNRTSQTTASTGAPAWGSGAWGCFVWTP